MKRIGIYALKAPCILIGAMIGNLCGSFAVLSVFGYAGYRMHTSMGGVMDAFGRGFYTNLINVGSLGGAVLGGLLTWRFQNFVIGLSSSAFGGAKPAEHSGGLSIEAADVNKPSATSPAKARSLLWIIGGAATAALAVVIGIFIVIGRSSSSTAFLAVFEIPFELIWAMPLGALGGWILGRIWRLDSIIARIGGVCAAGTAALLIVMKLGLPDFMPAEIARRHATLTRIGDPGIVVGADKFESVQITEQPASNRLSHLTGDFGEGPGDVIAVADERGADFFDSTSLRPSGHVKFGGMPDRLWHMFSTLARLNGRLVVVETGGGYSKTVVRELDGRLVWSFRPDPQHSPEALKPIDLDGNGKTTFIASNQSELSRLDEAGQKVWSWRVGENAEPSAIAPRTNDSPAWIVGVGSGILAKIRDGNGKVIADVPGQAEHVFGVVDWLDKRTLVLGGKVVRGIDINGKTVFEIPLGEFELFNINANPLTVRFSAGERPYLALVAASEEIQGLQRLLILSPERAIVYDEILQQGPHSRYFNVRLMKARRSDGAETLLISGDGLFVIRPRKKNN